MAGSYSFGDLEQVGSNSRDWIVAAVNPVKIGRVAAVLEGRFLIEFDGSSWGSEETLQGPNADPKMANLAYDDLGNLMVVYCGDASGDAIMEFRPVNFSPGSETTGTLDANADVDKAQRLGCRWQPVDNKFVMSYVQGAIDSSIAYKTFDRATTTLESETILPQPVVSTFYAIDYHDVAYSVPGEKRHFVCSGDLTTDAINAAIMYTDDEGTNWYTVDSPTGTEKTMEQPQIHADPFDEDIIHIFAIEVTNGASGDNLLYHYKKVDNSNWTKTLVSSGNASDADGVWNYGSTMDQNGTVYVAWSQWNSTDSNLKTYFNVLERGGAWADNTAIEITDNGINNSSITAQEPGSQWVASAPANGPFPTVYVLWREDSDGADTYQAWWSRSTNAKANTNDNETVFVFDGIVGGSWWKFQGKEN